MRWPCYRKDKASVLLNSAKAHQPDSLHRRRRYSENGCSRIIRNVAWIKAKERCGLVEFPLKVCLLKNNFPPQHGSRHYKLYDAALQIVVELARRFARFEVHGWSAFMDFRFGLFRTFSRAERISPVALAAMPPYPPTPAEQLGYDLNTRPNSVRRRPPACACRKCCVDQRP